jgi:hypothetical protein
MYDLKYQRVYPLGEDIPRYPVSIFFLVLAQVLQVVQVLQALQALQVPQAPQTPPSPLRVSPAAVIDCSQSTKLSPGTLKLQITPLISSYTFTSFLFDKTKLLTFHVPQELPRALTPSGFTLSLSKFAPHRA